MRFAKRARPARRNPWAWVPTVYMAEGIPYILVTTVSVILYKNLGISNTEIALYTSWLYLPWVLKPLWSPLVDMIRTKRFWIVLMQLLIGASLACIALTLPASAFFRYSLAIFWIMAFSSATHDIAADGFYMLGLEPYQQAAFVGVRTIFYRIAVIAAKGILVVFAGHMQSSGFSVTTAWSVTFFLGAAIFLAFALYSAFVLPYPAADTPAPRASASSDVMTDILHIFALFFRRKEIFVIIAFFLFYRFAEAQLVKMVAPFLLDPRTQGGLGLTTGEVGIVYGTVGAVALMLGGLLGGYVILPPGIEVLAVAHGAGYAPARAGLRLSLPGPAGEHAAHQHRRRRGAVRLRVRVYGLLALHDHGCRRPLQNGTLRPGNGDHGPGNDDPRYDQRLAADAARLSPLLPLDHPLDNPRVYRRGAGKDRSGLRAESLNSKA